jgi:DNA topoisomerase-3
MKKYLAITEKRDQAVKLAGAINLNQGSNCYQGKFKDGVLTVVWASGHLKRLKLPDEIIPDLSWQDPPSAYIPIPRDYETVINDSGDGRVKGMIGNIGKNIRGVDCVILATDSDREGEAIGRMLIEHFNFKGEVKRAWFAAGLDKKSLTHAMANLKGEFETIGMFRAAEARARTDRLYTYLTRAYTFYAKYGKFGTYLSQGRGKSGTMSVGRLQTVIVNMIVMRDEEIANFVAKDHHTLTGNFNFKGVDIQASFSPDVTESLIAAQPEGVTWEQQKPRGDVIPLDKPLFTDLQMVNSFVKRLKDNKDSAVIGESEKSIERDSPANTFELADAQAVISKKLSIDSGLVQTILEDLYEQGWTSYARTSKSEIPINLYEDSERNGMFDAMIQLHSLQKETQLAKDIHNGKHSQYQKFMPKVFSKKDMEHYGIVPTNQVMTPNAYANLSPRKRDGNSIKHTPDQMRGAYEIICKQFICAMLPPAEYSSQKIQITMPVEDILGNTASIFNAKARKLIDAGWKSAFSGSTGNDSEFPDLGRGDNGTLKSVDSKKQRTKPPSRYTKALLPKDLAKVGKDIRDPALRKILKDAEGIGRPATRKTAIETVLGREYVSAKGEVLYSTEKGRELVKYVPGWLKTPETSARLEDYMNKISGIKDDSQAVQMRDNFEKMQTERVETLIQHMLDKFQSDLGERVGNAPKEVSVKMKKFIKQIAAKKGIEIPRGTLSNPIMAKAFIDENYEKPKEGETYPPSEAQIKFAKRIVEGIPQTVTVDDKMYSDGKLLSDFINKNKKYLAPSEGQINLIRSIVAKLPPDANVPPDVETSAEVASKFIDANISKGKGKGKSKSGSKKSYTNKKE